MNDNIYILIFNLKRFNLINNQYKINLFYIKMSDITEPEQDYSYPGINTRKYPRAHYMPCDSVPPNVSYDELMSYINRMNKFEQDYSDKTDEEYHTKFNELN